MGFWPTYLAALLVALGPLAACQPSAGDGQHERPFAATTSASAAAGGAQGSGSTSASAAASGSAGAPQAHGARFAVATENETAATAALAILRAGGSAADAAIAAVFVDGVVQPVSSGLGGGGFALYWDAAHGRATVLDFRETAPKDVRAADFDARPLKDAQRGALVGVPGEVAGMVELHKRFGALPFADVVRPAAELARQGFVLEPHQARALTLAEAWVKGDARLGPVFAPGGKLLASGARVKNEALARTLEKIGAEGASAFYAGDIAKDVVDSANAAGGRLSLDDLAHYQVIEREPLHATWEGHDVYTMPPPSAGGLMLLETLALYGRAELATLGLGSAAYLHRLAEGFRGAIADRMRFVGDPAFVKVDVAALTAPARMQARRALIDDRTTHEADKFPHAESGTNHLVVVDGAGNVACVTSTVNNAFGSRLVTAGGFPLNDELDDFNWRAAEERFGKPGVNRPRPGARPVSSMTPTIVVANGKAILALGGSGGTRIATGVAQVLLAALVFERPALEAVKAARIETPPMGGLVLDEGVPAALVKELMERGEKVAQKPNMSAVQLVLVRDVSGQRVLDAGGDPRKWGAGLVE